MALVLYHDQAATEPIDASNPDLVHQPVDVGGDILDEKLVYLKSDDDTLTYENVLITAEEDPSSPAQVDITYALDNNGVPGDYDFALELPDGDFTEPVAVWRKVYVTNVQQAFRAQMQHVVGWTEYVAD